jgi:hypothetical protein
MLRNPPHESKHVHGQAQRPKPCAIKTRNMVDASRLGTHQGELGPICDFCGARLTFGQSIPIDSKYACFECYQKETGATPSSEPKSVDGLPID